MKDFILGGIVGAFICVVVQIYKGPKWFREKADQLEKKQDIPNLREKWERNGQL